MFMIDKIIATGIRFQDPYDYSNNFIIPEDKEIVLFDKSDKIKRFSTIYDNPIRLLIQLCYDSNFIISKGFKLYNSGYGCLDITFGSYQYTIQLGDGVVQIESLREGGSIVASKVIGSNLYIKDRTKILYNTILDSNSLPLLNFTEYGRILISELKKFVVLNKYSYGRPYKIYGYDYKEKAVDLCNKYLEQTSWDRKLIYNSYNPLGHGHIFTVLNTKDNTYCPIESEGSGFRRFLHIVEAVEESRQKNVPLIIENYGEGIDRDKCDVLFDIIKGLGINIVYSS